MSASDRRNRAPVLALDIGNVCLQVDLPALVKAMGFERLEDVQRFDSEGNFMRLSNQVECGEISVDEFLRQFGGRLPVPCSPAETRTIWGTLIGQEIPGMASLIDDANKIGLQVVFISDICQLHYELVKQGLSFFNKAAGAVLSYEVGHLKPHPTMYQRMEQEFCKGQTPLLFADDKEENIRAAIARNWPSYQVGTVDGLRQALAEQLA